jgi:poly(3-hydroxybutyrate) depolymerase
MSTTRDGSGVAPRSPVRSWLAALAVIAAACSSSPASDPQGTGGGPGTGGAAGAQGGAGASGHAGSSSGSAGRGGADAGGGTGGGADTGGAGAGGATAGSGGEAGTSARGGAGGATAGQSGAGGSGTGGQAGRGGSSGAGGSSGGGGGATAGRGGTNGAAGTSGSGGGAGSSGGGGGAGGGVTRSAGCGKSPTLKNSPSTTINYNKITSAGLSRQYILRYPPNYDSSHPYRLILAYHWYTGSASQVFDCNTESIKCYTTQSPFFGLWNLANNSTIFVAPDGIDAGWANTNGRDLALTDDILKEVEADLCVDTSRVFANGFSYGGSMTAMLACQRADVFRAVAVYAGGISGMSGACTGTMPIAYYGATGTQDSGYAGGQNAVQHFAQVNGCTAQTLPTPPTGGHTCVSFQGCAAGHPVRWCPFDDIHTPSPRDRNQSMTWQPQEVWSFLTQF